MTDKKRTPEEDFKRFESFIEDMSDMEFEEKMDIPQSEGGFSPKQKELFTQMREELSEEKIDILNERGFDIPAESEDDLINAHRDALRRFYSRW